MPAANKESVISLVHRANPKINFWMTHAHTCAHTLHEIMKRSNDVWFENQLFCWVIFFSFNYL